MEAVSEPQPRNRFARPNHSGMNVLVGDSADGSSHSPNPMPYSTQSLSRRLAPNSIGLQTTPTKMLLNQTRRSSSGIFISSMFSSRFRHLQKLHSEAFLGLNSICLPGLPIGAVFRSSLPATPVATPIHREAFQHFSEQAIRDRLCKTPSPRKSREFLTLGCQASEQSFDQHMRSDSQCSSGPHDSSDVQPMDVTTPIIDEPVIEDTKGEESANGAGMGQHLFAASDRVERHSSDVGDRLFVGNISYRVCDD